MKNLQGLLSFLESSSAGSFTLAAAQLGLTPAAVSKNVHKLEAELGVRLFNRSTRRIRLTAEGEAFALQARDALRALDDAVAQVAQGQAEPSGRVRISVGSSFGRRYVLPVLPDLLRRHPLLQVDVSLDNRTADLVGKGFDIGIRGGVVRDSSLVARRIAQLPLVLVASPDYLARRGVPASQADLAGHDLLVTRFASGAVSNWRFRAGRPGGPGGQALDWAPPARLQASDPEALVDLAITGAGVLQVALHHVVAALRAGQLKLLLGQVHDADEREIVLHYPHRQFLSPRVRVVVEALLAHFASATDLHLRPLDLPAAWRA